MTAQGIELRFAKADEVTINEKEAYMYMGLRTKAPDELVEELFSSCLEEVKNAVSYKACFTEVTLEIPKENEVFLGFGTVRSEKLFRHLQDCKTAYIFAATAGMDLHGDRDMSNAFATYAEGSPDGDPAQELTQAIQTQRTWVSKGMAVEWQTTPDEIAFTLTDLHKPGFTPKPPYLLTLTDPQGTQTHSICETEPLRLPIESLPGKILIPKLYTQNTALENLLCIAPVLRL